MLVNIQQRRKELGLTLEEVGKIVGVGKSTVKKWESGYIKNMRRDKIILLARALQISPLDILDSTDGTTNFQIVEYISKSITDDYKSFQKEFFETEINENTLIYQRENQAILLKLSSDQLEKIIEIFSEL